MALTDIFGRGIATIGQVLGLPEMGWSEAITGSPQQTQPYIYGSAGGAYVAPTQPSGGAAGDWPAPTYTPPAPTGGQVLGATAPTAPTTPTTPTAPSGPSPEELERQRREAEARGAIESGYSDYFAQLDAMLNEGLPTQKTAQEEIAKSQYTGGVAALQPQLQAGETLLQRQRERTGESQARNLRDISANLRNAFMTGNIFLGARGAGDSSAARMYSYALTKLGTRQRGDIMRQTSDIMTQIGDREINLKNIYNAEVNRLSSERDQKISGIASWFAEQQNALRLAEGQGQLAKGQDLATLSQNLLNAALSELGRIETEASNRRSALEQWAMNNATSIQQVKANLQQVSAFQPSLPQAQPIVGQPTVGPTGNIRTAAYGYGGRAREEEERPLFSPPSYG